MLRAAILALVGSVSLAAIYMATAPDIERPVPAAAAESPSGARPAPLRSAAPPVVAELRPAVAPAPLVAPAPPPVPGPVIRNVTPPGMTAGPPVTGGLVRIAPPPAPPPPAAIQAAKPARTERLSRPVIAAAGRVATPEREVRLAGVKAPDPEQVCGEGSSAWPCGRMARAALRRFVRGRAIECEVPAGAEGIPDPARCHVAGEDLSEWLVAQGWAARDGDRYAEVEAAARDGRRGVWAERRPGDQADLATGRVSASAPDSARSISNRVSPMP